MKRIVVTGGAGFIGTTLCAALLDRGDEVVCVDDFSSGSRLNAARFADHAAFTLVDHDVMLPIAIDGPVDEIYNLASPASPVHYQRDPVRTTRTNVLGALHVLDLADAKGARVLQASTSEIYGDPEVHPQPETYQGRVNPIGPRACYDEGKRTAESLFFDYRRTRGVRIKVARIFNTYGPHMALDDGRVVSNFIVAALKGEPIVVQGAGTQTRSFCYVDDLVDGLMRLMATDEAETGPVNIGNDAEFTIRELADLTVELIGGAPPIVEAPLPQDDPKMRRPDLTLARRLLGWEPKVPLREGLSRTIPYFRDRLASSVSLIT